MQMTIVMEQCFRCKQTESPVMSLQILQDRIALMKSTVKRPRHKRKRRNDGYYRYDKDGINSADDSSNSDSNSKESLAEIHSKKVRRESR